MSRTQKINFQSIEDFLDFLPTHEKIIVDYLRTLIMEAIPNCREKLAFNVPFYYRNSRICFIWPSSVPWGNVKPGCVQLGFVRGHLLKDELNYLDKGKRKQVCVKVFNDVKEIETDVLKTYLFEADEIDSSTGRKNRPA